MITPILAIIEIPIKFFGTTIKETLGALKHKRPVEVRFAREIDRSEIAKLARVSGDVSAKDIESELAREDADTIFYRSFIIEKKRSMTPAQVDNRIKAWMRIVVTLLLFAVAWYLWERGGNEDSKALPGTIIGAIIGYWLK